MPSYIPPLTNTNHGTLDPSLFTRTGSAYTDPSFLKLYMAQLDQQSFDTLFGDEGLNNSIFGSDSSNVFATSPSSTSDLFGGTGSANLPSDIAGGNLSQIGGSQYLEMVAKSNLIGKTVSAVDPATKQQFTGKVESVSLDNGVLLLTVGGKKVPIESILSISQ